MTTVEERVKLFLESWRETHCATCQGLLSDGKFIIIDGRLHCLTCHDAMNQDAETLHRVGCRASAENGHGHE